MSEKDGNELIDEIGQDPTLDLYFDRNPKTITDAELMELIEKERLNRALFIEKRSK